MAFWETLDSDSAQSPGGGAPASVTIDTRNADLIVVQIGGWFGFPTLSDSEGITGWAGPNSTSSVTNQLLFKFSPVTSATHQFTATGGNRPSIAVAAIRGGVSADTANQQNASSAGAAALTVGPTAPDPPNENNHLVVSTLTFNAGGTPNVTGTNVTLAVLESSGWTSGEAVNSNLALGVQGTADFVTADWDWTGSVECAGSILTFAPGDELSDPIIGSYAFSDGGSISSTHTVLMNVDGVTRTVHEPNTFVVYSKTKLFGVTEISGTLTVPDGSITNADLVDMAQATFKGRAAGAGTGDPTDLTADQASTILDGAADPFVRTSDLPVATDAFKTIVVSGQSDVVADSPTDTLTLVAGSNVTLTTNAGTDTITIASSAGGGGSISVGTYASLPAAGTSGRIYIPTNSYYTQLYDNGSTWQAFRDGQQVTVPTTSGWSWVNQGSATIDTTFGAAFLYVPQQGSLSARIRVRTAPSTPYVVTAAFIIQHSRQNTSGIGAGLCWRESGSGELITWGPVPGNSLANWEYALIKMNSPTSYNSEYGSGGEGRVRQPMKTVCWLRFEDNGTNRLTWLSDDGRYWREYLSATSRTDFLTADEIGFYCDTTDPNLDTGVAVIHWLET